MTTEATTPPDGIRSPEEHARMLDAWLRGAGSLAQEMLLHGRASIDLAVRTESTPSGVIVTVWLFDGAGLAVFHRPGRGYDRASAEELFAALSDTNVKQLVGTTPENFLDSLKRRLAREAKDISRVSGDASTPRVAHPPAAVAARDYVAYEDVGPPQPLDVGGIAVRASQAWWAGVEVAAYVEHETLNAHHGVWQQLCFLGKRRYARHWSTCKECRGDVERLLEDPQALFVRSLSPVSEKCTERYECQGFNVSRTSPDLERTHLSSCLYCTAAIRTMTERLQELLTGDDRST